MGQQEEIRAFFEEGTALHVNLVFHMHRPASHFKIDRGRSLESLKENFRYCQHIRTPNVDNMVKFVLDSPLDGVIYKNDSHVISIGARKCYDNVGECLGRTSIEVFAANGLENDIICI